MNSQVEEILKKHITTVNSFLDENGHNRFIECVEELTQLITSREQEIREEAYQSGHRAGRHYAHSLSLADPEGFK